MIYAAKSSLYKDGKRSASNVISQVTEYSPERAVRINQMMKCKVKEIIPYTPIEALAYLLNCDMTKEAYIETRLEALKRNANIYLMKK